VWNNFFYFSLVYEKKYILTHVRKEFDLVWFKETWFGLDNYSYSLLMSS